MEITPILSQNYTNSNQDNTVKTNKNKFEKDKAQNTKNLTLTQSNEQKDKKIAISLWAASGVILLSLVALLITALVQKSKMEKAYNDLTKNLDNKNKLVQQFNERLQSWRGFFAKIFAKFDTINKWTVTTIKQD